MALLRAASVSLLVALVSLNAEAFSVKPSAAAVTPAARGCKAPPFPPLFMAEGEDSDDTTFVSSVFKKEIAYDEKTGRFFETGYGEGECIPDEEFCMTDNESGEMIRLTVEEKERIFLDALQVRRH